jgi:hypothetical protein
VYRAATAVGFAAFTSTVNRLLALGFKDALAHEFNAVDGFDVRMVPSEQLKAGVIPNVGDGEEQEEEPRACALQQDLEAMLQASPTDRSALISARLGQGTFRAGVIKHWGVCAVTGADCIPLLRASHIKPWRDSNDQERVDPFNGILLAPNLDAAFDAGFISFEDSGRILLSRQAAGKLAYQLHITPKMRLNPKLLANGHRSYLQLHRGTVFLHSPG